MKRKVLGKGLDALLPQGVASALVELEVHEIRPNPLQPRLRFEPERLAELAASLAKDGVLQPIVVRRADEGYEIIAGERRWRAAQLAGLSRVPAMIQDVSDERMLELALIENIQRDELSPIEEAHAYELMTQQFALTQEEVATRVGRSRTAVTNTLRLLKLPKQIQQMVMDEELSMGHARALLPLPRKEQLSLAKAIVSAGLSVRAAERRVQKLLNRQAREAQRPPKDPNVRAAEARLEERFRTKVEIRQARARGQIILHFHSAEELDRLFEGLLGH